MQGYSTSGSWTGSTSWNSGYPPASKTLFCDFDGPIIDVSNRYYSTYQLALNQTQQIFQAQGIILPIQQLTKGQFWQLKQERTPDSDIALRSGLYQAGQIEVFLRQVNQLVNQPTLLQQDHLQAGVHWALAMLHSQGIQLVLVTLRCQHQAWQVLRDHGLSRYFTRVWGTQDETLAYANQVELKTQLLREAVAAQERIQPIDAAWMVGDTEADILAGQALGMPTIALTCGIRSHRYLKKFQPTQIKPDLLTVASSLLQEESIAI